VFLQLRSGGAQVLEGCIAEIHNITSLDISDNGLESDLSTLIVWLSKNRSIQHLALGKNFNNMKSKNLTPVLDNLVQMIQDEESPLQSLSLADSKLKTEVTILINALGSNTSLTKVDISGNGMGDMGAKMLAKALQINTKLRYAGQALGPEMRMRALRRALESSGGHSGPPALESWWLFQVFCHNPGDGRGVPKLDIGIPASCRLTDVHCGIKPS